MVTYYTQFSYYFFKLDIQPFQINFKVFGKNFVILKVSRWLSLVSRNACVDSSFASASFVFIAWMKSASNAVFMLITFMLHLQHWPHLLCTFFSCYSMNLKHYLCQCLSYSLLFSSQFWIYILSYTRPFLCIWQGLLVKWTTPLIPLNTSPFSTLEPRITILLGSTQVICHPCNYKILTFILIMTLFRQINNQHTHIYNIKFLLKY